jgi:serine/threonine protein kinase
MLTKKIEREKHYEHHKESKLWDLFEIIKDEKVGEGYSSEVFTVKKIGHDEIATAEVPVPRYAAKWVKQHAYWTFENELRTLGMIPHHDHVVKLHYVFDRREIAKQQKKDKVVLSEEDKKVVWILYDLCERGNLDDYI